MILYGEVYGPSVQSFHYGLVQSELGYQCFDIMIDGKYLDTHLFNALCSIYEIPRVPLLRQFPFSLEKVRTLSEGKTSLNHEHQTEHHIREGVVVKPVEERSHPKVGRCIFKYVSDDYLFSKKTDFQEV